MDWLFHRESTIVLAIAGAIILALVSILRLRGYIGIVGIRCMNFAGYAFMAASMILFIIAGYRAP